MTDDDEKFNEMMRPLTYRPESGRKYKYKHEDIVLRSKYRALQGKINRIKAFDTIDKNEKKKDILMSPRVSYPRVKILDSPRDFPASLYENLGMFSVVTDDTSTVTPRQPTEIPFRKRLEIRAKDGPLRNYSNNRVEMWNMNLKNDIKFASYNQAKAQRNKETQFSRVDAALTKLRTERAIQTVPIVEKLDSFDLTSEKENPNLDPESSQKESNQKLALVAGLKKVHVAEIDFLDGFDRNHISDCQKTIDEIYFKQDEEIVTSFYKLKSEIPSVQLTKTITVRVPAKIRFDSEKLKFTVRIKIGLVWRRVEARFEETPGTSIFEGYIVFTTDVRGDFFGTCDFVQLTYKVDKHGFTFRNALVPDIQVKIARMEEPEDVTFQIRLVDRERFSKHENISPRLIYPINYVTDGLLIRRNKFLYTRKVSPMLINITNDTSYGPDEEVYLVREKDGRINVLGKRMSLDKSIAAMLDHSHSTFWFIVTKAINKYKQYEPIIERAFSITTARISVCKILTFHQNKKEEFVIWIAVVERPDVDETINKFLGLEEASRKRLEMTEDGGVSNSLDFTPYSPEVTFDLDVNFKQRQYLELPLLKFKVGHLCRVKFKVKCRINPLLCDDIEKWGIIKYYIGSNVVHEAHIDTAAPLPEEREIKKTTAPEFSKEAIEKILSGESLHNIAYCLSENEGLELALRLRVPSGTVSKVLIMYGSTESKIFRLILIWKKTIRDDIADIKDFIEAFFDIERGDIAHDILEALDKCQTFKRYI